MKTEGRPRHKPEIQASTAQAVLTCSVTALPGGLLDLCGSIDPESPVVRLGSNFTAVCVLKEKCMDDYHVSADDIFWKTSHVTVPHEQYTVLNRTASSVTFTNVSSLNIQLTCNIRTFGQIDQNVYGIRVISGCELCLCLTSDFDVAFELYF